MCSIEFYRVRDLLLLFEEGRTENDFLSRALSSSGRRKKGEGREMVAMSLTKEERSKVEVTLAYGARQVKKLIEVLEKGEATVSERVEAIKLLCDVCSCQEKKSSAADERVGDIVMQLLGDDEPELVLASCKLIQSLGKIFLGRKVMKGAGVFAKLVNLIDASEVHGIKLDAARCIGLMTRSPDGVECFMDIEGTVPALVRYIKAAASNAAAAATSGDTAEATGKFEEREDDSGAVACDTTTKSETDTRAILTGTQALCGLTVRQNFLEEALSCRAHVPIIDVLRMELDDDINTACCTLLSHLCHHPEGKFATLEAGGLYALTPMLESSCVPVRQRATGAIAGLTIEYKAKLAAVEAAGPALVRLVNDTDAIVACNALICIENSCEIPQSREAMKTFLNEEEEMRLKDFVCWPKVRQNFRKEIRPFPEE